MLFPATSRRAALESVTELARRNHDEQLGPRSFHLFRLPVHLHDRLAGFLGRPDAGLVWPPAGVDALRDKLQEIAAPSAIASPGPFCLGKPARLNHTATIREIAAVYLQADRDFRVIPYFED